MNRMCVASKIPRSSDFQPGTLSAKPVSDPESSEGSGTSSRGSVSSHIGETPQENTPRRQILNIIFTTTINNVIIYFLSVFARHCSKCCLFSLHNDLSYILLKFSLYR